MLHDDVLYKFTSTLTSQPYKYDKFYLVGPRGKAVHTNS